MNSTPQFDDSGQPTEGKWGCQIMVALALVGVLGNLLVCFVILRVKFLHTMTNYLLVNLAVADVLLGVEIIFFHLTASSACSLIALVPTSLTGKQLFCRLLASRFISWVVSNASAYNLCLITLEKYVAILHPLHYARKITATRMKVLTALIWVISLTCALPFLFVNEPSDAPEKACTANHLQSKIFPPAQLFSTLLGYALPIIMMSVAYYKMQVTLKRQAKALNLQHAKAAAYDLVIARQRLVNVLIIVLGALIILWTPGYVVYNLCPDGKDQTAFSLCTSKGYKLVKNICTFLYHINSVINPVIYGFKYKKLRRGLKVACCSCFSEHNNQNRVDIQMAPQ